MLNFGFVMVILMSTNAATYVPYATAEACNTAVMVAREHHAKHYNPGFVTIYCSPTGYVIK